MLERAYRLASITRPLGGLWHPFRRRWATTRKHFPLKDVAQAGGWDDVRTLLVCYQQPAADTTRRGVDFTPSGDSGSVTYTQTYAQRAARGCSPQRPSRLTRTAIVRYNECAGETRTPNLLIRR